jgi:hypothetical protein
MVTYKSIGYLVTTFMPFSSVFIRSWTSYALIRGLTLSGENDHVLRSYTVTSLPSVRAIGYYTNKNWPRALAQAKQHCTEVNTLCSHSRRTSRWRGLRERLSPNHYVEFHLLFEQTHAHNYITPAATRCRPHWFIIREHTVVPTFV